MMDLPEIFDRVETWVFDLDNTLYPASSKLFDQISLRMTVFIAEYFDIAPDAAFARQKELFRRYGTTLRGLMTEHGMEPEPFLEHVHKIDVGLVEPNPDLALKLGLLPGRKLIFTNSSRVHAQRVMERIGITKYFEEIFDISDADYIPKPDHASYAAMLRRHEVSPETACMIDDIPVNLETANALGMATVWLRGERDWGTFAMRDAICKKIDFVADDLCEWLDLVLARRGT
ncbi:MAG TPA: pyrimidine 5'-nucleotidase [Alphaproteobacteria bacterium]|jgi:putative hydrolase of the HAD superfamily|nr:pyrimidine 5'-nucleotidase [Alphaproteobacteria bacterium]